MLLKPLFFTGLSTFTSLIQAYPQPNKLAASNGLLSERAAISPGPVMNTNFPDPSIINIDGIWYSFATRSINSSVHIQAATSRDFVHWELVYNRNGSQYDALPTLAPWIDMATNDFDTWAPDVSQLDDGRFIMYYCASTAVDPSKHCVSAAYADNPLGPYTPLNYTLYCPLSQGGAIDPAGFYERASWQPGQPGQAWRGPGDGPTRRWIVYKVDGGTIGNGGPCGNDVAPYVPTPLMLQEVDARDGITPIGSQYELLDNNGAADQGITEAPNLIRRWDGSYVLFFSSGCFVTTAYTVSYATAPAITGPYTRNPVPLLQTGDYGLSSPGGMSVLTVDDVHAVFHANRYPQYVENERLLHTAILGYTQNGSVYV